MKRFIKTGTRSSLHDYLGRRPFAALRMALACAVTAGTCTAIANTSPTAQDLFIGAVANVPASIVLAGTDEDGDPLTFSVVSPPLHGNLAGTPPNLTYTPNPGFVGLDGFQYFVRDAQATSDPATITINVKHGLSINNISVTEGNGGTTAPTFAIFTVTKSGVSAAPVSFSLRTADGTSRAGSDYQAIRFIGLTIPANQTSATVGLAVTGDRLFEFNESFLVQLFSPGFNAAIVSGIGRCTIVDDDGVIARDVGTSALMPENSVVAVGEPVNLSLTWTHPVGWRQLNSVDLLLVDDESEILRLRWHEGENSFSLFNPNAERFVRTAEAGSTTRFQTSAATLFLRQSTGGGPPGPTVTINFNLSFALQTAGRTFSIEAFATDDAGNQQGFESVGTLTVLPR